MVISSKCSPFVQETACPWVAILGSRNGYIQLATSTYQSSYQALPMGLFQAAQAWATQLETLGSQRVYWMILSEEVRHLHIHVYPRWESDVLKGAPLFEARETLLQPAWTIPCREALQAWAKQFNVYLVPTAEQ